MLSLSKVDLLVLGGIALGGRWLYAYIRDWRENPNNLPLPPGPKSYPVIGSLLAFPTYKAWLEYDKWFKVYGDMIYFKVLGQGFLILGSMERAYDLFERRSSNYSDRPRTVMLSELMGFEYLFGLHPYGTWWRRQRRVFHEYFHPNVVHEYQPIHLETSRALLLSLLESPENFRYHIRYSFAATIMKVIHGITIQEEKSYMFDAETALTGFAEAGNPGTFLVDVFPSMKLIPRWFPGAEWKRKAAFLKDKNSILVNYPWNLVKERIKAGNAKPCIAMAMQEGLSNDDNAQNQDEETVHMNVCATAYAGGSETTVSTVTSFFMAMVLYPEVQKKAQAELDRVLAGRLPEFNDRPNLPYIHSVVKESQRWQPVTPLAFAHMCSNTDEYDGYHIPKGTIVIGNSWSILHDPEIYKDPLTYNPDRFLKDGKFDPTVRDPATASFGFGRRICPGRFFSESSLFSIVAHVLTVFDIKPSLDENGKEVEIKPDMTGGFLSYPEPFECRIVPRSKKAEELIRNSSLMHY